MADQRWQLPVSVLHVLTIFITLIYIACCLSAQTILVYFLKSAINSPEYKVPTIHVLEDVLEVRELKFHW